MAHQKIKTRKLKKISLHFRVIRKSCAQKSHAIVYKMESPVQSSRYQSTEIDELEVTAHFRNTQ